MLEVHGISKRFGTIVALDGVDLSVGRGELVGFLGPNGAGKTTTMRAILGLIVLDGGTITWDGQPITDHVRHRIGYMPAERGMYLKMQVREQLVYFARLGGLAPVAAAASADEWIERLGLQERAMSPVQALSSGNQQRVQLGVALVHRPELLILDEPFSGLDPVAAETLKHVILEQVASGTALLFSSHQLDLVSDVSRQVVIIDAGRVVLSGEVDELRAASGRRLVEVRFDAPTTWHPTIETATGGGDAVATRHVVSVASSVTAASVLADAERAGHVVGYSFEPPTLSDVFFAAVGRGSHEPDRHDA